MQSVETILQQLSELYDKAVGTLRADVLAYARDGSLPAPSRRIDGSYAYPELVVRYAGGDRLQSRSRAFGRLNVPGTYTTTVTRPALFADYLRDQLEHITGDYPVEMEVRSSRQEIPFPYVLDGAAGAEMAGISPQELARHFPATELALIGDELADGIDLDGETIPLSLFDGLRTDFSLARLAHYTGTRIEDFQRFILFTNYHRYVDEFIAFASKALGEGGYSRLSVPGGSYESGDPAELEGQIAAGPWRKVQMPAYHLVREDRRGITLVNIGVGPSNAKNICDHVAVLRPEVWLMIGHCGGLRESQKIGDYVLAHAYLRDDHVLDDILPAEIPLPAIAEVQKALFEATMQVTGEDEDAVKLRLRTGTVVTTDDRNWELRYTRSALRFNQSRAVAIDMESATVAAQGYRHRVPYGTLLCVSDKPLHGEIKLAGQANEFYQSAISQHLRVGIEALELLKREGEGLHSRKLRSFDEPPMR